MPGTWPGAQSQHPRVATLPGVGAPIQVTAVAPRPSRPAPSSSRGTGPTIARAASAGEQ